MRMTSNGSSWSAFSSKAITGVGLIRCRGAPAGAGNWERHRLMVMAVTNVSHIAIAVRDMDRALPFWTEVVGLHVTLDTIEEFTLSGRLCRRRAVYLRVRDGANE